MFAVLKTGGKQYRVSPGNTIKVEKIEAEAGSEVIFDEILMTVDGENMNLGKPLIKGAKVTGKVLDQGRSKKLIVFKFKSKTRQRTKKGHRQPFTEVEITAIK